MTGSRQERGTDRSAATATLTVRDARDQDVDAIVSLVNDAYQVEQFFVTGPRTSAADVRALLATGTFLTGADASGTIVAAVYIERRSGRGYIGLLSVALPLQGQGLGQWMMQAAESRLAADGCTAVDIRVVNLRTELPPFYERLGYRQHGTEPFEDPRKTKPCHFLLLAKALPRRTAVE